MSPILPLGFAVALSLLGDLALFATLTTQLVPLNLSLAQAGILLSVHRLVRIPGNPLAGAAMDHVGRRPLFLAGMVLAVVSTASYGLAQGFWPLLAGRVAWGMAWTLINVGGLNMVLDLSTPAARGRLAGTYNAWVWVGYALAPLLGGTLVERLSFRPAMLILAAVTAAGLAVALFALPETLAAAPRSRLSPEVLWARLAAVWGQGRSLLRDHAVLRRVVLVFAIVQFAGDGIVLSSLALLVLQRLGESIPVAGQVLGAAALSGALLGARSVLAGFTAPLAGRLSDGGSRPRLVAVALALGALSFIGLALAQNFALLAAGVALGALAGGALPTLLPAYLGDVAPPEQRGAALGIFATFGDAGSMLGPLIALQLAPLVGLAPVYGFAALIFLAGIGLILR